MGLLDKLFKKKGKPIAKEEAIKETRKNDKEEATLYKFDGVKAMRIGNFPLAIKFFEKALEVCPEFETCCLLYTSPSPRDVEESRMPSSA